MQFGGVRDGIIVITNDNRIGQAAANDFILGPFACLSYRQGRALSLEATSNKPAPFRPTTTTGEAKEQGTGGRLLEADSSLWPDAREPPRRCRCIQCWAFSTAQSVRATQLARTERPTHARARAARTHQPLGGAYGRSLVSLEYKATF